MQFVNIVSGYCSETRYVRGGRGRAIRGPRHTAASGLPMRPVLPRGAYPHSVTRHRPPSPTIAYHTPSWWAAVPEPPLLIRTIVYYWQTTLPHIIFSPPKGFCGSIMDGCWTFVLSGKQWLAWLTPSKNIVDRFFSPIWLLIFACWKSFFMKFLAKVLRSDSVYWKYIHHKSNYYETK